MGSDEERYQSVVSGVGDPCYKVRKYVKFPGAQ